MTTDLDARWAVLAAETQHDGMRDSLRRRLHEDCETLAGTHRGRRAGRHPSSAKDGRSPMQATGRAANSRERTAAPRSCVVICSGCLTTGR
jgi:hypothetical protein